MKISSPGITDHSGPSIIWLIPLITALVGGWLIIKTLSEQGPVATISFLTADGIEAGKTRIKYKNVDIGQVEELQFSDDLSHVMLTVQFNQGTESFLRRNTRFWVVKPQFGIRGVSGLSTLVSGAYVEIEPGQGAPQFHFVGLEKPPVVLADARGKKIVLVSNRLGSIDTGSPVSYRGIVAGEVLGYELGNDNESVYIHAFIKAPFDHLLRGNTRFWNVSGMDVSVDADGLKIRTESFQSMLFGGIAFETPESSVQAQDDVGNLVFTLHEDYERIKQDSYVRKINYVVYFESTVRGLNSGAPVEFQGIRVGVVRDVRLEYDSEDDSFHIPVLLEIEPERIIHPDQLADISPQAVLESLVKRGLRARLQTGNLLTGQLYIDLGMYPDSELVLSGRHHAVPELPTIPAASLESITRSVEAFVARLDTVDIGKIGQELLGTLEGTNRLFNAPEVQGAIDDLDSAMQSLSSILKKLDESSIDETIDAANLVLIKLDKTLQTTTHALQPDSPLHYNLIRMTGELEETARSIRSLVETLERHPQSLIFGREATGE